jgi:hypothetical protein
VPNCSQDPKLAVTEVSPCPNLRPVEDCAKILLTATVQRGQNSLRKTRKMKYLVPPQASERRTMASYPLLCLSKGTLLSILAGLTLWGFPQEFAEGYAALHSPVSCSTCLHSRQSHSHRPQPTESHWTAADVPAAGRTGRAARCRRGPHQAGSHPRSRSGPQQLEWTTAAADDR